jgi:hypothetical protein
VFLGVYRILLVQRRAIGNDWKEVTVANSQYLSGGTEEVHEGYNWLQGISSPAEQGQVRQERLHTLCDGR